MATYYKYVDREAASVIDWNKISQTLITSLDAEKTRREELKNQIESNSLKFGEELDNAPQGDYTNQNTWILNAADKGQQMRLMQDRLLKNGDINLNQYMVMRRNTESDFKTLFNVSKEYQEQYKTKMERYKNDESSKAEGDLMKTIESLANFTKTDAYINPTTGVMNLSRKELVDGVYQPTGGYVSVQALRNRLNINVDKVKDKELASDIETGLGSTVVSDIRRIDGLRRIMAIEKTKDPTLRKNLEDDPEIGTYYSWENSKVDEYLANPYKTLSLLTDYVGKNAKGEEFELTFDEEAFKNDKTGKLYLMKDDGSGVLQPTFKEEQKEAVGKIIRDKYRNMIDREATMEAATEPDIFRQSVAEMQYFDEKGQAKKDDETMMTMLGYLYYGDNRQVDAASTYYRGIIPNVSGITRDGEGVTIRYNDGTSRTIPLKDANGNVLSQEDFVKESTELHGQKDTSRLLKTQAFDKEKKYNPFSKGGASVTAAPIDNTAKYQNILKTKGKSLSDLAIKNDAEQTTSNMQNAFGDLGFTFVNSSKGVGKSVDYVSIFYGQEKLGDVNLDDSANPGQFDRFIRSRLKGAPTPDDDDKNKQGNNNKGKLDNPGG